VEGEALSMWFTVSESSIVSARSSELENSSHHRRCKPGIRDHSFEPMGKVA
jgi:hypothetical protein